MSRLRYILPVLAALLLLTSCQSTGAPGTSGSDATLGVLTLNIYHDRADWPQRLELMVEEITALAPDVILLQEVLQNPELPNQAETLASRLGGYEVFFVSADSVGNPKRYGNAILSRLPVLQTNERRLQPHNDYRMAAHARIEWRGEPVDVYATHLHYGGEDPGPEAVETRGTQIRDLLDFVDATRAGDAVVVGGDFNTRPDSPDLQLLAERLRDAYVVHHPDAEDDAPEHTTLNPTFFENLRRIDYLWYDPEGLTPISAEHVLNEPNADGVWPSDHFGVLGRFRR